MKIISRLSARFLSGNNSSGASDLCPSLSNDDKTDAASDISLISRDDLNGGCENIEAIVLRVAASLLEVPKVEKELVLLEQSLDSFGAVEFASALSAELGLRVYPDVVFRYQTLGEIISHLQEIIDDSGGMERAGDERAKEVGTPPITSRTRGLSSKYTTPPRQQYSTNFSTKKSSSTRSTSGKTSAKYIDGMIAPKYKFDIVKETRFFNIVNNGVPDDCSSISGITIYSHWSSQNGLELKAAVQQLIDDNPILTGFITMGTHKETGQRGLCVEPYKFELDDIYTVIEWPSDRTFEVPTMAMSRSDLAEYMTYASRRLRPLVAEVGTAREQRRNQSKLFTVTLVNLPNDYVAISISASHGIMDGYAFNKLLLQLSQILQGVETEPLNWNNSPITNAYKLSIIDQIVIHTWLLLSAFVGFLWRQLFTLDENDHRFISINTEAVKELRVSMQIDDRVLSENDIISAATFKKLNSSLVIFAMNLRGLIDGIDLDVAGNNVGIVLMGREKAHDPYEYRRSASSDNETKIDFYDIFRFRMGFMTNVASISQFIDIPGAKLVCQMPTMREWKDTPFTNATMIFRPTKDTMAIFCDGIRTASSLQKMSHCDDLMDRIFRPF